MAKITPIEINEDDLVCGELPEYGYEAENPEASPWEDD